MTAATETDLQDPPVFPGACRIAGTLRTGVTALFAGGVQRLGVSPDGSTVVFEKTNRFSVIGLPTLDADREGFFLVRANGSGLRRLGPASRESLTRFAPDASAPGGFRTNADFRPLSFSADGGRIAFTDLGLGPAGEEATQVMLMDLASGRRTQVTHLPRAAPGNPPDPVRLDLCCARFFVDRGQEFVGFYGSVNPDGLNPEGVARSFSVRPDGTDLVAGEFRGPVPTGSVIDPIFQITSDRGDAFHVGLPGGILKIFFSDSRGNFLQLTNFRRADTGVGLDQCAVVDDRRVFFTASANPFGTNPSENCQIFSIDPLGADLRQLTDFSQGDHSTLPCGSDGPRPGCNTDRMRRDLVTSAIVFASSCDPFDANPNGEQIFAMNPDGTNLRQLTHTHSFTTEGDGSVDVELPGRSRRRRHGDGRSEERFLWKISCRAIAPSNGDVGCTGKVKKCCGQ